MKSRLLGAIVLAMALAATGTAEGQISDAALSERIVDSVLRYPRFSIFDDVSITVEHRNVTLIGRVTSPLKKEEIGKRVAKIDGIRNLQNDIGVLPVSQADVRLRNEVASAIYGHPSFWYYGQLANPPVHIIVENSRITLTGEVNSQVDSMLAGSLAQVGGVISVTNRLRVAPR